MICKECGTKLTSEQTTCPNCGALQQQAVPKKRKKSDTASQQKQPQSGEAQMQWQDRFLEQLCWQRWQPLHGCFS